MIPRGGSSRSRALRVPWGLAILLALCWPGVAWPHARTISYSRWRETPAGWEVEVRLPVLELDRRFGKGRWDRDAAGSFAREHFRPDGPGSACVRSRREEVLGEEEFVARWTEACPGPSRALVLDAFFDTAPAHLHYARVVRDGREEERVVTAADPRVSLDAGAASHRAGASLLAGLRRFAGAPAAVLLVAGLALLAGSRRSLARAVAALALTSGGACLLRARGVPLGSTRTLETLLGLSVLWAAVELFLRGLPRGQALCGRAAWGGGLLCLALLAGRGSVPVPPLCFLGLAAVCLGFAGLPRPAGGASVPWLLAAVAGPVVGARVAGSADALLPPAAAGWPAAAGSAGLVAGMILAETLAALGWALLLRGGLGVARGASAVSAAFRERVAASALLAAGTFGFLSHALGTP